VAQRELPEIASDDVVGGNGLESGEGKLEVVNSAADIIDRDGQLAVDRGQALGRDGGLA
jgi:hypothetical protein